MDAPIFAASPTVRLPESNTPPANDPPSELAELKQLTRQLIALQREQVAVLKSRQEQGDTTVAGVLQRMWETQREQLAVLKAQQAAADSGSRWRNFLGRWEPEFPDVGGHCKEVLPLVERAYLTALREVTETLRDPEFNFESEFEQAEFLDKNGVRLGQLGNLLNQLGPIADAAGSDRPG